MDKIEEKKEARKRWWRNFWDGFDERIGLILFLILGLSFLLAWVVYDPSNSSESLKLSIAVLAAGLTFSINYRAQRTAKDKLFKEIFIEFNARYQQDFAVAINEIEKKVEEAKEKKLPVDFYLDSETKATVIDYFNLCAEEYLWYKRRRIPRKVWFSWKAGMVYAFQLSPIRKLVNDQKDEFASYYGLFDYLKEREGHLFDSEK